MAQQLDRTNVPFPSPSKTRRIAVASERPFRVEVTIFPEQADFRILAAFLAKSLRRIHSEHQRFLLGLIGPEIGVGELYAPAVPGLTDQIARMWHAVSPQNLVSDNGGGAECVPAALGENSNSGQRAWSGQPRNIVQPDQVIFVNH